MPKEAEKPKSNRKTLESMTFEGRDGDKRMRVELVAVESGAPFRVRASVMDGNRKTVSSGYLALKDNVTDETAAYVNACEQTKKKGWQSATTKRGSRIKLLSAVPEP